MADQFRNYIDGEWVAGSSVNVNRNPSDTNDVVGEYAQADLAQARAAIAAAKAAFPKWSTGSIQERANILDKAGAEILARKDELGTLLSREEGKTLPEGIGEAMRAGQIFRFFAGEVVRMAGEKLASVRPGVDVEVTREPLGVIGLITPWNFPIAIPAWKIAPALAYGNTVVIKPADLAPGCAWAIAEILSRAGLPPGVLNLAMGRGSVVGEALVGSPDVTAISFTGSVPTGRSIAAKGIARMAKLQLEMGGKNPLVVLDDADLPTAVNVAVQGSYFSTGQRCTASSRIIVTPGIHDRFVAAVADKLRTLRVDNALLNGTDIGPVVDEGQLGIDQKYIAVGQAEGAQLVTGGERVERATPGYYMSPALFAGATNAMRIAREEIFGPVACVIKAQDYDEALAMANDTEFGLSAGIVTTSLKHASHFKRHSQAGMVMVNVPTAGVDYHVPFGGRKGSSYGSREQGRYAAEFFTTVKTAYTAP
jgi:acyl-CoA reductase-like NAD-dependent aldehyde dehydrogenase